jgi:hypothetical protein
MRKTWPFALMLLALAGPAVAETVTVETTLGERGFAEGFLLSGRQASSLYLPLPAGTDITNLRIGMKARAVAPNLQRGSVVIIVNGQPVDALRLDEDPRAQVLRLDTLINEGDAFRAPALDLRFRADLIAHAEFCTDHFDPADTLQVLPETTIAYDIDLGAINTIRDALALLPGQPAVEVPLPLTPEASAAALKLSAMLAHEGYRARFTDKADADAPVSLRLVSPSADGAIRLEHETGGLRIQVPENADIAGFARLWQAVPLALAGETLRAESPKVASSAPAGFSPLLALPGPLRVVQTGELGLDFPMLDDRGRRASEVKLRLTVAPDWSEARPVITLYLNGQLIAAVRAEIGENILTTTLPGDLLRLSNRLSVVVDRAQAQGYCPGPNPGHAVQLLPGTGIDYEGGAAGGFAVVAGALRRGGTLVLPETAKGAGGLAYLTLASRVLSGLGLGAAPIEVRFGETTAPAGPVLSIGSAGVEGLVLPIGQPELALATEQPLAGLTADPDRQRLDIRVLEGQELPDPAGIYLGNGSAALVGPEGVIWQDSSTSRSPSVVERGREVSRSLVQVLRSEAVLWGLIGLMAIIVVVLARALRKRHFRKASK